MDNYHKAAAVQLLKEMQKEANLIARDFNGLCLNDIPEEITNAIASISSKQSAMIEIMINMLEPQATRQ